MACNGKSPDPGNLLKQAIVVMLRSTGSYTFAIFDEKYFFSSKFLPLLLAFPPSESRVGKLLQREEGGTDL